MTALSCPYCGAYADFKVEHEFNTIGGQFGVWSCAACGKPVTGVRHPQEGHPLNPEPKNVRDPSYPDVPDSIARDAIEAPPQDFVDAERCTRWCRPREPGIRDRPVGRVDLAITIRVGGFKAAVRSRGGRICGRRAQ